MDANRIETRAIIDANRIETQQKIESYRVETRAIIDAIHQEMKDFHMRLYSIEEKNKKENI